MSITSSKKVNFMVKTAVLAKLENLVPKGQRSEFVNEVLNKALTQFSREKAAKLMDEFRKNTKISMTNKEIIKLKNYGRK